MRKIALLLSVAAAMVVAFGVVPTVAAKKRREDGDMTAADERGNDIGGGNGAEALAAADHNGDKRFPARYAADEQADQAAATAAVSTKAPKLHSSKQHNAKLLNRLGMKRIRTSGGGGGGGGGGSAVNGGGAGGGNANHHRKRLASQSRSKYGGADGGGKGASDSQMFIVKLPPHAHFYDDGSAAAVHQRLQNQQLTPYKNVNTVPVGFVSNGKPAKVYHWNLPTIKHALSGARYKGAGGDQHQMHQLHYNLQHAGDFELPSAAAGSKIVPRRTLYYKPRAAGKPVKKSFVNNGKPNGFYVMSTKNAAAAPQYHKIVKAYYGNGDD